MTIDADGHIWVAVWDGWSIRRYDPDGRLTRVIDLPVARVTSCTFGGPDLADLYITTARSGLTPEQLNEQPLAGGVFRCRPGPQGRAPSLYLG
jgi:sugar lactone lactonase YvrE